MADYNRGQDFYSSQDHEVQNIFSFRSSVCNNQGRFDELQKIFGKVLNLSKTGSLMNLTINSNVMGAHTATEFRVTLSSWAGGPNLVNLQSTQSVRLNQKPMMIDRVHSPDCIIWWYTCIMLSGNFAWCWIFFLMLIFTRNQWLFFRFISVKVKKGARFNLDILWGVRGLKWFHVAFWSHI